MMKQLYWVHFWPPAPFDGEDGEYLGWLTPAEADYLRRVTYPDGMTLTVTHDVYGVIREYAELRAKGEPFEALVELRDLPAIQEGIDQWLVNWDVDWDGWPDLGG